jgi:hypothetical protein
VLFLLVVNVQAQTKSYTEQQKINHLICFIGNMPDAIFIPKLSLENKRGRRMNVVYIHPKPGKPFSSFHCKR